MRGSLDWPRRTVIKSVSCSQHEILNWIKQLHCPSGFECDITYGNGSFYSGDEQPPYRFDIDPQVSGVIRADSRFLPLKNDSVSSVVFDPPFLTYVRAKRSGNGKMVMSKRFSGYWKYEELERHYSESISESSRVLRRGGVLVVKCQDIVHNHRLMPTHFYVDVWARESGLRLLDMFVLVAKNRMPSPNRKGSQKHSRIFHSYFMVFKK
jgi:hypothetical protein